MWILLKSLPPRLNFSAWRRLILWLVLMVSPLLLNLWIFILIHNDRMKEAAFHGKLHPMKLISKRVLGPTLCVCTLLLGCERDSYTTWSCSSATESKIPMVLRKAQMELKDAKLNYCGSLGHQSFFDLNCSVENTHTRTIFVPSSGSLTHNGLEYQCTAL